MPVDRTARMLADRRVAVVLPCYNEGLSIAAVVLGFQRSLPGAQIIVFDNASDDNTAQMARAAGARVVHESRRGKGNVVRRIFSDIDAELYVMADGDGTYDPADAPALIETLVDTGSDMVVGVRRDVREDAGRAGHAVGNVLFNRLFRTLFGPSFNDIFSGYRVFTRRFAKSFPAAAAGFEIETEMSVHACELRIPVAELEVGYGRRKEGSASKLRTVRDGLRILWSFVMLFKEMRPFTFYASISAALAGLSVALIMPVVADYLATGTVTRLPTAVLSTGLMLAAFIVGGCGVVLDSLKRFRIEHKRLVYLSLAGFAPAQAGAEARPAARAGGPRPGATGSGRGEVA